jgi:hypothetical protein
MAAQQEAEAAAAAEQGKAQAQMEANRMKAENDRELGMVKAQGDMQISAMKAQMDNELAREAAMGETEGKMLLDTHATDEDIRFEEAKALIGVQTEELKMQAGLIPTPEQEFAMRQAEQQQAAAQGEKQADKQFGREKEKMKMQSGLKQQEIKTQAKFRPKPAAPVRKPAAGAKR